MSNKIEEQDIDFSRGDDDIVFIHADLDTSSISRAEDLQKRVIEEMSVRSLELENVEVIGVFKDEFSLLLKEDAKIILDGKQIYP